MSQNNRATPCSVGRQGRTANVLGSGIAIMSDSSIGLKPVIEDPSKPIPPANASLSSEELIENALSCPRMSVNQRRMKRMFRSATIAVTSSVVSLVMRAFAPRLAVAGGEVNARAGLDLGHPLPGRVRSPVAGPAPKPSVGPLLKLSKCRLQLQAHARELIFDPQRRSCEHPSLHYPARLELLHPLGEQPI